MEKKKRIVILGAGISGLSAAFFLAKEKPEYDCLILEKENKVGGYMETGEEKRAILEKGPHIFKVSRNQDFLDLVDQVGFSSELIFSSKKAKQRYLWIDGKVKSVLAAVYKPLIIALLWEWSKPVEEKEETIRAFAIRRFGLEIAQRLFDPIVLGVYAGDSNLLSINACFPVFKRLEKKGSVIKGLLCSFFSQKGAKVKKKSVKGLFSFKEGVGSFIKHLEKKIPFSILYGKEAKAIEKVGDKFRILCGKETFEADEVILAVPAFVAASLIMPLQEEVANRLFRIPYQSITSVNVLLPPGVLKQSGFGYLIPSIEKDDVLGVLFDSNIFPTQDQVESTKLTFMIRGCDYSWEEILSIVERCLHKHLRILQSPQEVQVKKMGQAIPQYILGHKENIETIQKSVPLGIHVIGNYLEGVSVNDAIKTAKNCIKDLPNYPFI